MFDDIIGQVVNAIGNLFSSGAGTAANQVSGGELGVGTEAGYGSILPSWLSGALGTVGQGASAAGNYAVSNPGETLGLLSQAGNLGTQIAGAMAPPSLPLGPGNNTGVPMAPTGLSQPQLRSMISNRQASGVYTGGATTPESIAALGGEQQSPEQIQAMMGSMYPGMSNPGQGY